MTAVALLIGVFLLIAYRIDPPKDLPAAIDLRIRAFGSCAFLMLTMILSIGPLARLDRRFLPLLYNRRHFGVLTFVIASLHVWFMLEWYAVQGTLPNLLTELMTWGDYGKFIGFPFKVLGIAALVVLFLMAATSHDFWLAFLTPRAWVRIRDGIVEVHPEALPQARRHRSHVRQLRFRGSVSCGTVKAAPQPEPIAARAGWGSVSKGEKHETDYIGSTGRRGRHCYGTRLRATAGRLGEDPDQDH
jgi:DMSO/TMAO reductase YedYZ heme-binding membrane subunit